jgi:nucleoredoxin
MMKPNYLLMVLAIVSSLTALSGVVHGQEAGSGGFADIFPEGLINAKGEAVSLETLNKKIVGIYFSAHWCGPCRKFTPTLIEYRNTYKDDFEVVFVSSDRSAKDQLSYMSGSEMPWPALAWQSGPANKLKKQYGVSSIPALIIMKPDGDMLTAEGRRFVSQGVEAEKFKTASLEKEEYNCGRCSKVHVRSTLVFEK